MMIFRQDSKRKRNYANISFWGWGSKRDVTRGTAARGSIYTSSKLAMDDDHEVRDSNRSDTEGDAESDLDGDRVSPSEESGDSSEELTHWSVVGTVQFRA